DAPLLLQRLLGPPELLLGALARREDRGRVLERRGAVELRLVATVHHATPSSRLASAVPSTRARILPNATSRGRDTSSQNGENPQSSVVPSCGTGMYLAASSTRSRTSSGVSTRRSSGEVTPTKIRWPGRRYSRMIASTRSRSGSPASAM